MVQCLRHPLGLHEKANSNHALDPQKQARRSASEVSESGKAILPCLNMDMGHRDKSKRCLRRFCPTFRSQNQGE